MKRIRFATLATLAFVSIASAVAAPPGWKTVVAKTGGCQLSVPPNWVLFSTPGSANSPASTTTTVVQGTRPYSPFSEETLKILDVGKVYENTSTRLFYVSKPFADSKAVNYYVAIPGHPNVCIAQMSLPASYSEDEAKAIAATLAPVK